MEKRFEGETFRCESAVIMVYGSSEVVSVLVRIGNSTHFRAREGIW